MDGGINALGGRELWAFGKRAGLGVRNGADGATKKRRNDERRNPKPERMTKRQAN